MYFLSKVISTTEYTITLKTEISSSPVVLLAVALEFSCFVWPGLYF